MRRWLVAAALACAVPLALAQPATTPDPWAPIRFLEGKWEGKAEGRPGQGTVTREYQFVMRGRYLHERNISTYPPQDKNPQGEVHEHWSFFSYDRPRKLLVLRQFHVEGFVNQFRFEPAKSDERRLVFESEAFENIGSRWRARETYEILGPDEFREIFELAAREKDFEVYSTNHFKRVAR